MYDPGRDFDPAPLPLAGFGPGDPGGESLGEKWVNPKALVNVKPTSLINYARRQTFSGSLVT